MKILNTILCIGCFLCCAFSTFAQKISGVIRDGKTNEPIIGAIVSLKGTSIGSSTDIDGKFELRDAAHLVGKLTGEVDDIIHKEVWRSAFREPDEK